MVHGSDRMRMSKIILCLSIPVLFLIIAIYMFLSVSSIHIQYQGKDIPSQYEETIEYVQGMTLQTLSDEFIKDVCIEKDGQDIRDHLQLMNSSNEAIKLGDYTFEYGDGDEVYLYYKVTIVDTSAPMLTGIQSYTTSIDSSFTKENLQIEVYDAYDMDVLSSLTLSSVNTSKAGIQKAVATITDKSGNQASMQIEVHVKEGVDACEKRKQIFVHQNNEDLTLLLNTTHFLKDGWEPDDLQLINHDADTPQYLRKEAAQSWDQLYTAAKEDDISIQVVSSFRTQDYQEMLFNSYLAVDPNAASYSAKPRSSEHELGLALDISYDYELHDDLQTSELGQWMEENGYLYGWIVRYPQGKEEITQYIYEPWHYRYVGKDLALYLHEHQLSLEEYYADR